MPDVNISAQKINRGTGTVANYTTVNATDVYLCDAVSGTEILEIVGDASAARVITITPQAKVDGISLPNITLNVAANQTVLWGVVDSAIYASGGRMRVTANGACKLGLFRV